MAKDTQLNVRIERGLLERVQRKLGSRSVSEWVRERLEDLVSGSVSKDLSADSAVRQEKETPPKVDEIREEIPPKKEPTEAELKEIQERNRRRVVGHNRPKMNPAMAEFLKKGGKK